MLFYDRRKLLFTIIALALIVVAVIAIVSFRLFGKKNTSKNTEGTPFTGESTQTAPVAVPPKDPDKQAAESLARTFVERIGSFSNQSNFQNLTDLESVMTPRVREWAEGLRKKEVVVGYQGTTTKVLTVEMTDYQPHASAVIRTGTQRQETKDGGSVRLYYQNAEVHLIFQNNTWLVDGIFWKEEH